MLLINLTYGAKCVARQLKRDILVISLMLINVRIEGIFPHFELSKRYKVTNDTFLPP